jgi:DNA-binding NarL/FixJ family response regulator
MNAVANKSLLIIDDHPVYRDALSEKLLRELMADDIEVAVANSVNEGLDLIQHTNRHWVILLDVMMPGLSGLPAIKVFKEQRNVQHVVAISGLDEHTWETKTVAAGAALYLSKNSTAELIIRKIKPLFELATQDIAGKQHLEPKEFRLTQRQLQVLDLISKGHSNKVIADYLDISEQTVKIHINLLFKELRVFNRTQAVLMAQKHQLLP